MAHLGTWKRLIKRFSVPFLALVTCVSAVSLCGALASNEHNAIGVRANTGSSPNCIGITFIDQTKPHWSGNQNDPYIYIESVTWHADSVYSSFSDFSTAKDGVWYDSSANKLKIVAGWEKEVAKNDWTWRYYSLQIPWYITSCTYHWKMGADSRYHTGSETAAAGHTYADYLHARNDSDSGDYAHTGTVSHVTDPGEDNLSSSTWSGTGVTVTEYAVIDGNYDAEKVLYSETVIQNSKYTVSENANIDSVITYDSTDYVLVGYYTNSTLTSSKVTQIDVGTSAVSLYACLVTPAVYFVNGADETGFGSFWTFDEKLTTADGGDTYTYTWSATANDVCKICACLDSVDWISTYSPGTSHIVASGLNFKATATGNYTFIWENGSSSFTVHEPAATVDIYYIVCGTKGGSADTTRAIYPNEPTAVFADIDPEDIGYNNDDYYFDGYYFSFDEVLGVDDEWTSAQTLTPGSAIYAVIEKYADDFAEDVWMVDEDTPYSNYKPTEGKMYYKTGSGKTDAGAAASDKTNRICTISRSTLTLVITSFSTMTNTSTTRIASRKQAHITMLSPAASVVTLCVAHPAAKSATTQWIIATNALSKAHTQSITHIQKPNPIRRAFTKSFLAVRNTSIS